MSWNGEMYFPSEVSKKKKVKVKNYDTHKYFTIKIPDNMND